MSISLTDPSSLALGLEQLLVAGANRSALKLPLDDLEAFLDLLRIGAGAVPAEQKLHHVGGHRVLPGVAAHEVLADEVAPERTGRDLVEGVHFDR